MLQSHDIIVLLLSFISAIIFRLLYAFADADFYAMPRSAFTLIWFIFLFSPRFDAMLIFIYALYFAITPLRFYAPLSLPAQSCHYAAATLRLIFRAYARCCHFFVVAMLMREQPLAHAGLLIALLLPFIAAYFDAAIRRLF